MLECTELELEESPWLIAPIVLGAMTARRTAAGRSATVRHAVTARQSVMARQGARAHRVVMPRRSVMGHRVVMAGRSAMVVRLGRLGALTDTAVPAPLGLVGLIGPIGRRETTTVRATTTR